MQIQTSSEWDSRIEAAAKALNLPGSDLIGLLGGLGVTNIQMLNDKGVFIFGDFADILKHKMIGMASIRLAFKHLKGPEDEAPADGSRASELRALGFKVKLNEADTSALLKLYLPDKPNDPITLALKNRFGDKPIIAFRDDGSVAVEATLDYAGALEQGYPPLNAINVDGQLVKLWPVGVKPDQMVDEDPLFPGSPLRNGSSIVNHRNWSEVSHASRQLCRIIVERGDIDPNNREAVLRLLERAANNDKTPTHVSAALSLTYSEAWLEFRERQKRDELPKLKVQLGANTGKKNNPFGSPKQY